MGLPLAIKAHSEGDLKSAARHYKRALEQQKFKPELFQNYGALLRANGDLDQAKAIYLQGLELYPGQFGIIRNYANLLRERQELAEALRCSIQTVQLAWLNKHDDLAAVYSECADLLRELGALHWAFSLLRQAFAELGVKSQLLWALFRICSDESASKFGIEQTQQILQSLEERLDSCTTLERAEFLFSRAIFYAQREEVAESLASVNEAYRVLENGIYVNQKEREKAQQLMDVNSWNSSCILLKVPHFAVAWKLYDYGLRAPAVGRQRWQRHLKKVFTHKELSLWRGEDISGKRLLLLEEQAIGDTMMFLTLLPALVSEAGHIGLVLSNRLVPIYRRSCGTWIEGGQVSVWGHEDAAAGRISPADFDLQSPVGSVCQYRFTRIESYAPKSPVLTADENRALAFRGKVKSSSGQSLRIGISWRGGGRSDRIKLKSVDAEMMADLMRSYTQEVSFVNLQYGDVNVVIKEWQNQGLSVVNEPSVNPLKNMEEWLNLVASCDAVLSVANTTIHGAGGLNIPTLCLLSLRSDWRWLNDANVSRSYWYPSVGIARECKQKGWSTAFMQAREWISAGCPMPDGPVCAEAPDVEVPHAFVDSKGF